MERLPEEPCLLGGYGTGSMASRNATLDSTYNGLWALEEGRARPPLTPRSGGHSGRLPRFLARNPGHFVPSPHTGRPQVFPSLGSVGSSWRRAFGGCFCASIVRIRSTSATTAGRSGRRFAVGRSVTLAGRPLHLEVVEQLRFELSHECWMLFEVLASRVPSLPDAL